MRPAVWLAIAIVTARAGATTAQVEQQQPDAAAEGAAFEAFLGEIRATALERGIGSADARRRAAGHPHPPPSRRKPIARKPSSSTRTKPICAA